MIGGLLAVAAAEPGFPAPARWSTIETRFWRIHAPAGSEGTAQRAAAVADAILLRVAVDAGFVPNGRYDLVVTDAVEGMTAYSLPRSGLVVIGTDPGSLVPRLRGRLDWVEDALGHEIAHVVWHRRTAALAGAGAEVGATAEAGPFGVSLGLPVVADLPYGLSEGLAELGSEVAGINAWDARREGLLFTSAREGRLLTWDEWVTGEDKDDVLDAERAYQQGYAFVRWLRARFGPRVLEALGDRLAARWTPGIARALRDVTGVPARTLWAEHAASLVGEAAAAHAARVADGLQPWREIERFPPGDGLADRDAATGRVREELRESTGSFDLWPTRSPDGRWIAESKPGFLRVAAAGDATPAVGAPPVVFVDAPGGATFAFEGDAVVHAGPATLRRPAWAPAPESPPTVLWRTDLATGRSRRLPGTERARDVALGPAGALAWVRHVDGTDQLVVDGVVRSTFPTGAWLSAPSFSPDGARLALSVFVHGRGDLWALDLDGFAWRRLTDDAEDQADPRWTPEGLLHTAVVDGAWQVVALDPDSGARAAWTTTLGGAATPTLDPDGTLRFAETTAWGTKSVWLRPEDRVVRPLPSAAETRAPAAPPPAAPPLPARRSGIAPLRPQLGPLLRLDWTSGVPSARIAGLPGARVAGGATAGVADARSRWTLDGMGLLGTASGGWARLGFAGLGPELAVTADGSTGAGRVATALDAELRARWNDGLTVAPRIERLALREDGVRRVASDRAVLALEGGPLAEWGSSGTASLTLTGARSDGARTWARAELAAAARLRLGTRVGPLAEHHVGFVVGLDAGATAGPIAGPERLFVGGDLPGAWRPLAIASSASFPALAPYALGGPHAAVVRQRWEVPLAPRLRAAAGGVTLRSLTLAAGADAAAVASERGLGSLAGGLVAELRLRARLADAEWSHLLRVAVPAGGGPPRLTLGIGSG